jgi:hypothetical protein
MLTQFVKLFTIYKSVDKEHYSEDIWHRVIIKQL